MPNDPEGLVTFSHGGKSYTAVFGFRAMKAIEAEYDLPFFKAVQAGLPSLSAEDAGDPVKVAEAGAGIRMTAVGSLFRASLMKHHPGVTEDDVDEMIDDIGLERAGDVIGRALAAAMAKEADGSKSTANPPKKKR